VSLDLAVITDKKLSKRKMKEIFDLLKANGFHKDQFGHHAAQKNVSLDLFIDLEPEKNEFWTDEPPEVVWFTPLTEINLESRHTRKSHEMSYRTAKKLAKLIEGVIYDNQVGAVYDANGKPCHQSKADYKFEKYGASIEQFMRSVGMLSDILKK
jgi:hypothetical protein